LGASRGIVFSASPSRLNLTGEGIQLAAVFSEALKAPLSIKVSFEEARTLVPHRIGFAEQAVVNSFDGNDGLVTKTNGWLRHESSGFFKPHFDGQRRL